MITLTCVNCGKEARVLASAKVQDMPTLAWWDMVGKLCKNCRVSDIAPGTDPDRDWLPDLIKEFDATVLAERVQCAVDHKKFCCATHGHHTTPHKGCILR